MLWTIAWIKDGRASPNAIGVGGAPGSGGRRLRMCSALPPALELLTYDADAFFHGGISAVGHDIEQCLNDLGFSSADRQRRARMNTQRSLHGLAPDRNKR